MPESNKSSRARNLALAAIAAQAGFWIVVMVFGALLLGLWLDAQFGLRGPFTIVILALSVPVTLWVSFRIVLRLIAKIQAPQKPEDDSDSGVVM